MNRELAGGDEKKIRRSRRVRPVALCDADVVVVDLLDDARLVEVVEGVESQIEIAHVGRERRRCVAQRAGTLDL